MLGAIIGDIIGSRWEFNTTNNYNFKLFSDENQFTDDTICTIAVADTLIHDSDDYGYYIHNWCRRYPSPMGGYGLRFFNWVWDDNPKPYNSFGNGSAMRVSPVAWWFNDYDKIVTEATKTAECTHNHPLGINGAVAIAAAIYGCRSKGHEGIRDGIKFYPEVDKSFEIESYRNIHDETCQRTVPPALWIIQHSSGFEDAIRQAVSLGADADTIGAITGSIAEAIWGIPEWMKETTLAYLPDEMKKVIELFYKHVF